LKYFCILIIIFAIANIYIIIYCFIDNSKLKEN